MADVPRLVMRYDLDQDPPTSDPKGGSRARPVRPRLGPEPSEMGPGWTTGFGTKPLRGEPRRSAAAGGGGGGGGAGGTRTRNAAGGRRVQGNMGFGGTIRSEIRALQNSLLTAARNAGYSEDKYIPGVGLTPRQLRGKQYPNKEAEMRAAIVALRRPPAPRAVQRRPQTETPRF